MLLTNTTLLYIYPKIQIKKEIYNTFGEPASDRYKKARKIPLGQFYLKMLEHRYNYMDFIIATDYYSLESFLSTDILEQFSDIQKQKNIATIQIDWSIKE